MPVNGKFTARQREIYEVVLGAQKAAICGCGEAGREDQRPEARASTRSPTITSTRTGKDLHGEPLGKYFIHGLSHHVGLDVHDESDLNTPLDAGMVITIEPGVYLPEENIGVRIEDMVVVTGSGAKVLSSALPREPGEIERLVGK